MISSILCLCILSLSIIQVEAYGSEPVESQGGGQRYVGAKLLPPAPSQYAGGQQEPRSGGAPVGGYGTIPPPPPPARAIEYPPIPPPQQERAPQSNNLEQHVAQIPQSQQFASQQWNQQPSSGAAAENPYSGGEPGRGGPRPPPLSPTEQVRERSPPFESGQEKSEPGRHLNPEIIRAVPEATKISSGSEPERYTAARPISQIGIKEPMQPSSNPDTPQRSPPGNAPRSEGVQYDEKTIKAKSSTFFGDTDVRNRDRPLEPTKKHGSNNANEKLSLNANEEKSTECNVQPNSATPKCTWQATPQHHLNLWPNNMFASTCESLVKSVAVCQTMCERQSNCQSVHFCSNCVGYNCRLISEKQNGKSGLKLIQEFKFVDYYEKSAC